jgi:predicted acyltransferase
MHPRAEVAPSLAEVAVAAPSRIASIDIFRGLTILVMIFVNDVGEVKGLPWWTHHAPPGANYMTYVDMVFPAFLFIVGMSIPLALGRRKVSESTGKLLRHILLRSTGLVVIGIFLANLQKMDPHLSGIDRTVWALLGLAGIFLLWNVYPGNEGRKTFYGVTRGLRPTKGNEAKWGGLLGGPPGPRGSPRTRSSPFRLFLQQADEGVGCGPGGPPHLVFNGTLKISGAVILAVMLAVFRRKTEIGQVAWLDFSYWEILGLIGCAYFAVSILYLLLKRKTWMLVVALVALNTINAFSAAGKLGWMEPVLRYWPFEAGLCAITMAGVVAAKIFFDGNIDGNVEGKMARSFRDKAVRASGYGALLFAAGLALCPLGIAKLGDTPTWGLFSASACTFIFLALYWIADVKHQTSWAAFVKPAGSNTLLTYLLPDIWYVIPALAALGDRWDAGAPGVIRAFVFTAIMLAASAVLTRWKLRLQL